MNNFPIFRLFACLIFFLPLFDSSAQEIKAPSGFRKTSEQIPTARFLIFELNDFRLVFSTESVLSERISCSVCVLDDYVGFKEIVIAEPLTISEFMKLNRPDLSSQWQIRIIKKNLIAQTPISSEIEAVKKFFSILVEAGDILIITVHQENPSSDLQILGSVSK